VRKKKLGGRRELPGEGELRRKGGRGRGRCNCSEGARVFFFFFFAAAAVLACLLLIEYIAVEITTKIYTGLSLIAELIKPTLVL